jgi:hypothetical protein
VSDHQKIQVLTNDLEKLCVWSKEWLLSFNEGKYKVMHYGLHNPREQYAMNGTYMNSTVKERDFLVTITPDLKWAQHMKIITGKSYGMGC